MKIKDIVKTLKGLELEGGATYKNYKTMHYNSGYQVSKDDSLLYNNVSEIDNSYKEIAKFITEAGGCIGLYRGINGFYIDKSFRVEDKEEAILIAKKYNQESILEWSTMECIKTM